MSVRPSVHASLRDRWADVNKTWHVYGQGNMRLGNGILNFGPCAAWGRVTLNLEMTHLGWGACLL